MCDLQTILEDLNMHPEDYAEGPRCHVCGCLCYGPDDYAAFSIGDVSLDGKSEVTLCEGHAMDLCELVTKFLKGERE